MADSIAAQVEEQTEQQTPETTEGDLEKMSLAELEAFATGKAPEKTETAPAQGTTQEPTAAAPETKTEETPVVDDKGYIVVDIDGQRTLRFKSQAELLKSYTHAQKLIEKQQDAINKYNAERGTAGRIKTEFEKSQQVITDLQNKLAAVQRGNPSQTLQALTNKSGQSNDPVVNQIMALQQELAEQRSQSQQMLGQFQEVMQGLKSKEETSRVETSVQGLYGEVTDFQKSRPEYATKTPFAKIDELYSKHGDQARTLVDPQDFETYQALLKVVELYKQNDEGAFDIGRKNFGNFEEAYIVNQYRNGSLSDFLVQAKRRGIEAYDKALSQSAQSAVTLPNNVQTQGSIEIGQAEVEKILSMDSAIINKDPLLKAKFDAITKSLGIRAE